jgi:hypothetical protein
MKRNLLTFSVIFLLASIGANAQHRFFITPGFTLAKSDFGPIPGAEFKSIPGFDGGVGAEFKISKHFAVQPEINYSQLGVKAAASGSEVVIKTNYITLPVLAKLKPTDGLGVFMGPQAALLTSATVKYTGEKEQNAKSELKAFDIMGVFGMEYRFRMGLVIGARYQVGFRNVADISGADTEIKNNALTFRVGYSFPFSGTARKK